MNSTHQTVARSGDWRQVEVTAEVSGLLPGIRGLAQHAWHLLTRGRYPLPLVPHQVVIRAWVKGGRSAEIMGVVEHDRGECL